MIAGVSRPSYPTVSAFARIPGDYLSKSGLVGGDTSIGEGWSIVACFRLVGNDGGIGAYPNRGTRSWRMCQATLASLQIDVRNRKTVDILPARKSESNLSDMSTNRARW